MMVVEASIFQENINQYGPIVMWIGNFIVHYVTIAILLFYMHSSSSGGQFRNSLIKEYINQQPSKFFYYHVVGFVIFILIFSYVVIFHPNSHYGMPALSSSEVIVGSLGSAFSALLAFTLWTG
jgi:hypothetical protein